MAAEGCRVCQGLEERSTTAHRVRAGATPLEALNRAAVGNSLVATIGASIAQEYVGAQYFSVILPGLVGLFGGGVARWLAGPTRAVTALTVALVAAAYGAASALLDFRITQLPFGDTGRWLPPLLAAVAGGLVGAWPRAYPPAGAVRRR